MRCFIKQPRTFLASNSLPKALVPVHFLADYDPIKRPNVSSYIKSCQTHRDTLNMNSSQKPTFHSTAMPVFQFISRGDLSNP